MSKYDPLTTYLKSQPGSSLPITFREIERLVGAKLPGSAYKYPAWWSNNPSNNVMTTAWLAAGWVTSDVDVPGERLVFRRRNPPGEVKPPETQPVAYPMGENEVRVSGLSEETVKWLSYRAEAAQKTVPQIAADILAAHVKPSLSERLAIVDRLRMSGPVIRDVDVVAMIRKDRDRQ